jgi:thiamine-phosphate diphosphorylase
VRKLSGIYVITDDSVYPAGSHGNIARQRLPGGARVIQLRDKRQPVRKLIRTVESLIRITNRADALLIVTIASTLPRCPGSNCVHLGPDDMPPVTARTILGAEKLIGVSVSTANEARAAAPYASYIGVGSIFATTSKKRCWRASRAGSNSGDQGRLSLDSHRRDWGNQPGQHPVRWAQPEPIAQRSSQQLSRRSHMEAAARELNIKFEKRQILMRYANGLYVSDGCLFIVSFAVPEAHFDPKALMSRGHRTCRGGTCLNRDARLAPLHRPVQPGLSILVRDRPSSVHKNDRPNTTHPFPTLQHFFTPPPPSHPPPPHYFLYPSP